jgi:hypothetical protein
VRTSWSRVAFTFIPESVGLSARESAAYPSLRALTARCEALPEFKGTYMRWLAPGT